jgi:hypothetical protein
VQSSRRGGVLEFNSEANLALTIAIILSLTDCLPEGAVASVVIGAIEYRPIEYVEVVNLQDTHNSSPEVETLSGVQVFVVGSWVAQS